MRKRSNLLRMLHALNDRMILTNRLRWRLGHFEMGYQYECWADEQFAHGNWFVINSLSLSNEGEFVVQMDLLVLTGDKILLYELKAYSQPINDCRDGTIQYEENGEKYPHPINQLENAHRRLQNLIDALGVDLKIESYVMLTHPESYIMNLPSWTKNLLIQSQISGHILEQMRNAKPVTAQTKHYYALLKAQDHDTSEYNSMIPEYSYDQLRKVVKCPQCFGVIWEIPKFKKYLMCPCCGENVAVRDIARLAMEDYLILFKEKPTMHKLHEWCGGKFLKHRLYQMLS